MSKYIIIFSIHLTVVFMIKMKKHISKKKA